MLKVEYTLRILENHLPKHQKKRTRTCLGPVDIPQMYDLFRIYNLHKAISNTTDPLCLITCHHKLKHTHTHTNSRERAARYYGCLSWYYCAQIALPRVFLSDTSSLRESIDARTSVAQCVMFVSAAEWRHMWIRIK